MTGADDPSDRCRGTRCESDDGQTSTPGDWPVELGGITESVVTTRGPDDRWNVAALGLHAGDPVTAKTYGRTRTWHNFRARGRGYVQFTRDPELFVIAALDVDERDEPVLDDADAWVEVSVELCGTEREPTEKSGQERTRIVSWELTPVDAEILTEIVPTTNRGYYAVVEATVAASRLDVDGFDRETLLDRLAYFEDVVETCGGAPERAAFDRLRELVEAEW